MSINSREDIEKVLTPIKDELFILLSENEKLKEENIELQSEIYKDKEIERLDELLSVARNRAKHYGMSERDYKKLMYWWDDHVIADHKKDIEMDVKYPSKVSHRPSYHIRIDEFAECTCYSIVCGKCKKSKEIYY